MSTSHDLMRERLLAAVRNAAVAAVAGVDATAWASTSAPRVLATAAEGYIAGLHRGRLPLVEVSMLSDGWDRQTPDGGTLSSVWRLRVHVAGVAHSTVESAAREILQTALAAIRSDDYLNEGEVSTESLVVGAVGYYLDATVTLAHVYDEAAFLTGATVTPGDPVVVLPAAAPGETRDISHADASPVSVFTVSAGWALDGIDVTISEAWDGTGAGLLLGLADGDDTFFASTDLELDAADVTFSKDFNRTPGPFAVVATITPGAGGTTGTARVQIRVTSSSVSR